MSRHFQKDQPHATAYRVAIMFGSAWLQAQVTQALRRLDIAVDAHDTTRGFIQSLQQGATDIGIVEDAGDRLDHCLASLWFQGSSSVPVLALGDGSVRQIARALQQGAADYAVIGESMECLVNRVCARIEASRDPRAQVHRTVGECRLDSTSRSLSGPVAEHTLTSREFGLAWVLFERPGQVVNLKTLSSQVWGRDASLSKRTIEQHISQLRRKLREACGALAVQVQAVNGIGYRLVLRSACNEELGANGSVRCAAFKGACNEDPAVCV